MKSYDHLNSRKLLLFNFERLDILCAWIEHPSEKLWAFEFLESLRCSISSVSTCDVPESVHRVYSYDHLNFTRAFVVQFRGSQYVMCLEHPSEKLWQFEFLESFHCSISSVSIYYAPESDIRVKSYDHKNFLSASIVQFRASRYVMFLNRTSVW